MRVVATVLFSISVLVLGSEAAAPHKNECDCKRKIMKASTLPLPDFESVKHHSKLHPMKDICSKVDVANVRPSSDPLDEAPKFAPSTSCECGFESHKPAPMKYPADVISQYLAAVAARKKTISESDLYYHGLPMKLLDDPKKKLNVPEELLYKMNLQPIELKPTKNKYDPTADLSEDVHHPCQPDKQIYADICYGKVEASDPALEEMKQEEMPCQICTDHHIEEETTEPPAETEEECDSEEVPDDCDEDEEDEDDIDNESIEPFAEVDEPCDEDEYRKRSIRPSTFDRRKSSNLRI
ncbi:glutamic acid-rich protein-like [Armigeres subalbatus]|uniref:glutamic acid-rich protein-like n=1 Tax=Armigeres subalbatus TaxID=124917 RepID=UPI002ED46179